MYRVVFGPISEVSQKKISYSASNCYPFPRPVRNSYPFNQNASLYRTTVLLTVSLAFAFRMERYLSLPRVINLRHHPTIGEKNEHNIHIC